MSTAIYLRISTIEQKEGFGLDIQRKKCLAYAEFKEWQVTHEFSDEGISGTLDEGDRPGLAALFAAIDAGEVDTLIVASLDRLARKLTVLLDLKDKLDEKNITFASCKETIDTGSPTGIAMMQMIGVFAEWEKSTIVARMAEGKDARCAVDGEKGGRMLLGYARDGKSIIVVPDEAAIVRQVFEMREQGAIYQQIADNLNAQGLTSKQGGKWWPSTVKQVLSAEEKYRGGVRGYSPVYWPAILEG